MSCKFLHITVDEENWFKRTGELPAHQGDPTKIMEMQRNQGMGGFGVMGGMGGIGVGMSVGMSGGRLQQQHCVDFQMDRCKRESCRFRHITKKELGMEQQLQEMRMQLDVATRTGQLGASQMGGQHMGGQMGVQMSGGSVLGAAPMLGKRSRREEDEDDSENEILRKKVTTLQNEILSLREMVDKLYEQNSKYRMKFGNADMAQLNPYGATTGSATAWS